VNRKGKRYLAFIPVPTLVVVMSALYLIVKPSRFYEPPWLLPITNAVFVTVVFLIVAYIAMRNYKATGRIQILLLGCGVLAFGIGGLVAGFVRSIPGAGANLNVTIYNTGALIGAVFQFAAALILLAGISPEVGSERKEFWLVFSYVGLTVFMALFTIASLRGSIPPFFIRGVGPTALRQWVLGCADILFAFSFFIFMASYLRNREVFLYWYSSALALTSISLTAFFIESAVGSPIGWAGRFSQYLGGIYFLVAIITAIRNAKVRRTSFDHVLTASLSPAEEKFRALAEHSPDVIERFDKRMKYIYVNQAGLRLYGKPSGPIIGKKVEEVGLTGPYVSVLKERIQRVFETAQPMEMEHYIPTRNGTRFYQSHCVPEFGVDGTVANVLVVSRDLTERKQAEEALRESEERYRSLFSGMTEGFALHEIICDEKGVPCDYRFLEINQAFERLTGLRRENVVGKTMSQILPNDDPKWVKIYGEVTLTGKSTHFDNYSPVLKRHYEVFAYCPAPRQFGVLFMDITERKQAEAALRESEARLKRSQEIAKLGSWELDLVNNRLKWSDEVYRIFGLQPQEFDATYEAFLEAVHPDDRAAVDAAYSGSVREGRDIYEIEHRVVRKSTGEIRIVHEKCEHIRDASGRIIRSVGMIHDITERKQMEEVLRRSRDELEIKVKERTAELQRTNERLKEENQERIRTGQSLRLEEARLDALLHLSKISEASLKEITGFTLEQAIGLTHSKIGFVGFLNEDESVYTLHAVSKDVVKQCNVTGDPVQWHVVDSGIWADAIRERKTLFVNDYTKPHPRKRGLPPGHPYVERFMVVPILEGERIVALAGVGNKASAYDKSDERQIVLLLSGMWGYVQKNRSREELQKAYNDLEKTNAELGKYNRQLEALNKELQDFAFVASHDLQEPLRKVRTFGDMLVAKCGISLDEASRDYLRRMQTAAARMQNLLNSLLSYSRVTTKEEPIKETDLKKSVEAALSNLEITIKEKNARVGVGDLPTVRADTIQMIQLFQNLIGNALKFSREGEAPHVEIYAREVRDENGAYEICVEDNGIGFNERYLDKIFLPFQRLHGRSSNYEGVGMGLAICKKIVKRHGGEITATSKLGKGSTFIVKLPGERKVR
jgi:PAS domain S-box-containing protein